MLSPFIIYYMGCCNDCLTCDIAFNAVMPLSRALTRGSYSRIEGITSTALVMLVAMGGGALLSFSFGKKGGRQRFLRLEEQPARWANCP